MALPERYIGPVINWPRHRYSAQLQHDALPGRGPNNPEKRMERPPGKITNVKRTQQALSGHGIPAMA